MRSGTKDPHSARPEPLWLVQIFLVWNKVNHAGELIPHRGLTATCLMRTYPVAVTTLRRAFRSAKPHEKCRRISMRAAPTSSAQVHLKSGWLRRLIVQIESSKIVSCRVANRAADPGSP